MKQLEIRAIYGIYIYMVDGRLVSNKLHGVTFYLGVLIFIPIVLNK